MFAKLKQGRESNIRYLQVSDLELVMVAEICAEVVQIHINRLMESWSESLDELKNSMIAIHNELSTLPAIEQFGYVDLPPGT